MEDVKAITAVGGVEQKTSSLASYQNWLAGHGHMPIGDMIPNHPAALANDLINGGVQLSGGWNNFIETMSERFSVAALDDVADKVREGTTSDPQISPTGSIRDSADVESSGVGKTTPVADAAEHAGAMIREAAAGSIEAQWKQTVKIMEHKLSTAIIMSSVESSISTAKQFQNGLNTLLRG